MYASHLCGPCILTRLLHVTICREISHTKESSIKFLSRFQLCALMGFMLTMPHDVKQMFNSSKCLAATTQPIFNQHCTAATAHCMLTTSFFSCLFQILSYHVGISPCLPMTREPPSMFCLSLYYTVEDPTWANMKESESDLICLFECKKNAMWKYYSVNVKTSEKTVCSYNTHRFCLNG